MVELAVLLALLRVRSHRTRSCVAFALFLSTRVPGNTKDLGISVRFKTGVSRPRKVIEMIKMSTSHDSSSTSKAGLLV